MLRVVDVARGMADEIRIARLSSAEWLIVYVVTLVSLILYSTARALLYGGLTFALLLASTTWEDALIDSAIRRLRTGSRILRSS